MIGAGPAGLTAALELVKAGARPVVFESSGQVGGISQTVVREGWRFDIGGHRFFTKVPRVSAFWKELLPPEDFLTRDRLSRIYYRGRFFAYPIKPLDALVKLGPLEAARCVASYFRTRLDPPEDQSDFESWVAARFGWRLYRIFFKTYTEKVWGVPASTIRSDWAAQRIKGLSLPGAIYNAFRSRFATTKHTSLIERFEYPRLGPGMMWEKAAERLREAGVAVQLDSTVVALHRGETGVRELVVEHRGARTRVAVDHVISSMPLGELARQMVPPAPEEVLEAAKGLAHRDFLTVALVVDERHAFEDNWIYIHDPSVKLGRVQNFGAWSPDMVKPGKTCLGLEYFVFEGDELWGMDDDDLVAFASEELERVGLVPASAVEAGYVVRMPRAYPVYDEGFRERVETIRAWLEEAAPNVHPVGRNGMHRYNNQDHSMLTAMLAVEAVLGAARDPWAVNLEAEYHEEAGRYGAAPPEDETGRGSGGRAVPRLVSASSRPAAALPAGWLASRSKKDPRVRDALRFAFRTALSSRRRLKTIRRALSPASLGERSLARKLSWRAYHVAFSVSHVAALRRLHFRLRDRLSRRRRTTVPLASLQAGGWNGLSARRFAEATGLVLDPSTPLSRSAQVDLLRRYQERGADFHGDDEALAASPYVERLRLAVAISGHYRGARTDAELLQLAREFLDRYDGRPVPYRPGRSADGVLPRVRAIARSDRYEVRDGHHRLAIELAKGATTAAVVVERPRSTTPVQVLLREMSWLDGQRRLYQPVPFPEVATWTLMRRCTDRLEMMLDFLAGHGLVPAARRSYLDVGACYGWFVNEMAAAGFDAVGIEQDPRASTLAQLAYGLEPGRLVAGDAVRLLDDAPSWRRDVVSCFSMLHHFVLGRGTTTPERLVRLLDGVTGEVLFLDTGQSHERWFRHVLAEWDVAHIRAFLLDNTSFTSIEPLGADHDDRAPFSGKFGRTLFACTR